jgi:hypothetical protein
LRAKECDLKWYSQCERSKFTFSFDYLENNLMFPNIITQTEGVFALYTEEIYFKLKNWQQHLSLTNKKRINGRWDWMSKTKHWFGSHSLKYTHLCGVILRMWCHQQTQVCVSFSLKCREIFIFSLTLLVYNIRHMFHLTKNKPWNSERIISPV